MNVETLKKVNALAKSLQEQGLAANMEDAMRLASGMVGNSEQHQFTTDAATQMQVKAEETNNSLEQNTDSLESMNSFNTGINKHTTSEKEISSSTISESVPSRDVEDLKQKLLNLENRIEQNNTQSTNNFNFIQQIGNEIDKVYEKLNSLTKNLNELKEKMSSNQQQTAALENKPENSFVNQNTTETKNEPDQTGSTTSGELTPDNIDIRNYFYSGKK